MANKRKRANAVAEDMLLRPDTPPQKEIIAISNVNEGQDQIAQEASNEASEYERSRQQRIKENLERMAKLGIVNLSLKLKSLNTPKQARKNSSLNKTPSKFSPPLSSGPTRRSSRLQNATPVTYCELELKKKSKPLDDDDDCYLIEKGSREEIYTEKHEKLLGNCGMSWTLFVDGCGPDGKRIYDSVKGKTCHQCRQKTLGHRTHCSRCQMIQGQFCGDCLYMRYGENVLEANQNPDWICPVCRGICNCSLCRQAKGWPPTGTLYRKIKNLGFKSVAHYLIETKRAPSSDAQKSPGSPRSAKRSLAFADAAKSANIVDSEDQSGHNSENAEEKPKEHAERKETETVSEEHAERKETETVSDDKPTVTQRRRMANQDKELAEMKETETVSDDKPTVTKRGRMANQDKELAERKETETVSDDKPTVTKRGRMTNQDIVGIAGRLRSRRTREDA